MVSIFYSAWDKTFLLVSCDRYKNYIRAVRLKRTIDFNEVFSNASLSWPLEN